MSTPPSSQPRTQGDASDTNLPKDEAANMQSVLPPTAFYQPPVATAPLGLQAGARPLPDYELIRQLGVGGFGEVWQARGPGGFDVALKFVRLDARGSESELRALEIMKTIRHPNLVALFGVWTKESWLIVAMELCDRSLHDCLQEARQQQLPGVPLQELLKYMQQAAEGLDELNAKGVQHRDVKPRNLMLVGTGVKVADFGLAKVLEQSQAGHSGSMTLNYAAPEAFNGMLAAQSDQYALAISYYELRTGSLPFHGNAQTIMYAHLEKAPDLSPLSAEERPILARALAKKPKERWQNCTTFVNELIKAHQTAPSKPPQPAKTEALPQSQPAGKQADSKADLLAQPSILPPSPASRRDSAPTELRKPETPDKTRGIGWLGPLLVGLLLVILVSCGAIGVLSGGIWLFYKGTGTDPKHTDQDGLVSRDKDKAATDAQENDNGGPKLPANPSTDGTKLPPTLVVDLGDGVKMEFVLIDPRSKPDGGAFQMGDADGVSGEKPHSVRMVKPYYLGKYVVTQEQYKQVTGDNPSWFRQGGIGADQVRGENTNKFPVECVSWSKADSFCTDLMNKCSNQLSAELRQKGYRFALPTEAQWEYACRAGTKTRYFFGDNEKQLGDHAWFDDNSGHRTHAVTEKNTSNPWGLYDMHGNVYQWCQDYYDAEYYANSPIEDPFNSNKRDSEFRILRGGSCYYALPCRAAYRNYSAPDNGDVDVGFRVCVRLD